MSQSNFPLDLGQPALNHHMDRNILSISHSPPPPVVDNVSAPQDFTHPGGTQRKFTLLSRPQQPLTSNSTISPYQHNLSSSTSDQLNSATSLNQQSAIQPSGSVAGRAARDDYYDTEDPSVNLHEFIVNSMQAQKNRVVLMKLEEEFVSYVSNPSRTEPLKLPPWDSYHRMLAHRVAAYFGLEHNVDPIDKTRVVVGKGPNTRMPKLRFGDYMAFSEDSESVEPKLILKRKQADSIDKFEVALASLEQSSSDVKVLKSFEEREEEYEKARARIFSQQSPLQQNAHCALPYDLATKAGQRLPSSIFPSVMHHRRAASDTSMFKRVGVTEMKKDSSSTHSSRSATPLVPSFLKLGGSCELLSSSVNSRVPPPMQVQTSPKAAPQQQIHKSVIESSSGQSSQFQAPSNANSLSVSEDSVTQSQHGNSQALTATVVTTVAPTSVHYQPVQANQPGLPVIYSQHPTAVLAEPNWYPYQQMMVYQVSPPGYVPAHAHFLSAAGSPHVIPGAVYPFTPGVIGQPALVAPPVSTHPGSTGAVARVPLGIEPLSSSSHPSSGVALVRPVPQQASPVRLAKVDAWNFSPNHHYNIQQSLVAQQISSSGQPGFSSIHSQQINPSHLADQMDSSLHISNPVPIESTSSIFADAETKDSSKSGGDGGDSDSGFISHLAPRMSGNTAFSVGNLPLSGMGEQSMFGGQMISPTHPHGPLHYVQPQVQTPVYGGGGQDANTFINNQTVLPNNPIHFPPGSHSQPSTPTIGPLNLAPPGILQAQQQGIFSAPTTGITRSPVQILGHTLGTSLFSPPPSSGSQHGQFVNSPTSSGKVGLSPGTPNHPPVGSGTRCRQYDSPKQGSGHVSEVSSTLNSQSGFQALPPRLAQQHGTKGGNRYQNQRHPSNRVATKGNNHSSTSGPVTLGDHMPSQFVVAPKREPLLPTPPSTQMVKLDTNLSCGVPVNVMEVVDYPMESGPDRIQALKAVSKLDGLLDVKTGKMGKTGEEVVVAIFSDETSAALALQSKHTLFSLSIPRNNHAKFILNMLQIPNQ